MSGINRVSRAGMLPLLLTLLCSCASVNSALTTTRAKVDTATKINDGVTGTINDARVLVGSEPSPVGSATGTAIDDAFSTDDPSWDDEDSDTPGSGNGAAPAAFMPVLDCDPAEGVVGEEISLACHVADPSGRPVSGIPVVFSIADALGTRDLGIARSDGSGMAAIQYVVQWQFSGRQSTRTLQYWARVEASAKLLPSTVRANLIVRK